MPAYDFENKKTGKSIRLICSYDEKDEFLKEAVDNVEDWRPVYKLNMSTSGGRTTIMSRTSEGFKDRIRAIKAANPGSTINI